MNGAQRIFMERARQVDVEGYSTALDLQYERGELVRAANCYINAEETPEDSMPAEWPWDSSSWKPTTRERNLEKAGALLLAEADRLDRTAVFFGDVEEILYRVDQIAKELDSL